MSAGIQRVFLRALSRYVLEPAEIWESKSGSLIFIFSHLFSLMISNQATALWRRNPRNQEPFHSDLLTCEHAYQCMQKGHSVDTRYSFGDPLSRRALNFQTVVRQTNQGGVMQLLSCMRWESGMGVFPSPWTTWAAQVSLSCCMPRHTVVWPPDHPAFWEYDQRVA